MATVTVKKPKTVKETPGDSPALCEGGCGTEIPPGLARQGVKYARGHKGGCPPVEPSPVEQGTAALEASHALPPSWGGGVSEEKPSEGKPRPRVEQLLSIMRDLHIVEHMTYPLGHGVSNVHIEGGLADAEIDILKAFLKEE